MPRHALRGRKHNKNESRFRYDKTYVKPIPAYSGKCPLCGDTITKAQFPVQRHVGSHIQKGDITKEEAASVTGQIYSYKGEL